MSEREYRAKHNYRPAVLERLEAIVDALDTIGDELRRARLQGVAVKIPANLEDLLSKRS